MALGGPSETPGIVIMRKSSLDYDENHREKMRKVNLKTMLRSKFLEWLSKGQN